MKTPEASRQLAESLVAIGEASGVRTEALITRMDAPLGREVGNALEVIESIETLKGSRPSGARTALGSAGSAHARRRGCRLRLNPTPRPASARRSRRALASRNSARSSSIRAAIRASSTTTRFCRRRPIATTVAAPRPGFVAAIEAERVGRAAVALGAGRGKLDDVIDHGVGITVLAPPGSEVRRGDAVLEVRHRGGKGLEAALAMLEEAVQISDAAPRRAGHRRRSRVVT